MAKSFGNIVTFLALLCLCFLLLSPTDVKVAEAKVCKRYSESWTGTCDDTNSCDSKCRKKEGARFGACHKDSNGMACFCYFKC